VQHHFFNGIYVGMNESKRLRAAEIKSPQSIKKKI